MESDGCFIRLFYQKIMQKYKNIQDNMKIIKNLHSCRSSGVGYCRTYQLKKFSKIQQLPKNELNHNCISYFWHTHTCLCFSNWIAWDLVFQTHYFRELVMPIVNGKSGQHRGDFSRDWWWGGQVVSLGYESVLIGSPRQSDFLSFGRDVERHSLVGATQIVSEHFLCVRFIAGCTVGIDKTKHLKQRFYIWAVC